MAALATAWFGNRAVLVYPLVVLLGCATAAAQRRAEALAGRAEAVLERELGKVRAPVACLVAVEGHPVLTWYRGSERQRGAQVKVGESSLFAAGALAEPVTAVAVLRLAQDGKLDLDDPIDRYLPDVPRSARLITVRHLLLHATGLPPAFELDARERADRDAFVAAALRLAPGVRPGGFVQYSALDFALAAAIVERTAGQPFQDHVRSVVFAPAGMDGVGLAGEDDVLDRRRFVTLDGEDAGVAAAEGWPGRGATDLVTDLGGLLAFYRGLRGTEVLDDWHRRQLFRVAVDGRTVAGTGELDDGGRLVRLRVLGAVGGFRACWSWDPDSDRFVALLSGAGDAVDLGAVERILVEQIEAAAGALAVDGAAAAPGATASVYDAYLGRYRIDSANALEVAVDGEHMVLRSIGQTASARLAHGQPTLPEWPTFYDEVEERAPVLLRPMLQKDVKSFARSFHDRADQAAAANGVRLVETLEQELGRVGEPTLVGTSGAAGLHSWFHVPFGDVVVALRITWHGERFDAVARDPALYPFSMRLTAASKHRFKGRSLDGSADLEVRFAGVTARRPARQLKLYDASKSGKRGVLARRQR